MKMLKKSGVVWLHARSQWKRKLGVNKMTWNRVRTYTFQSASSFANITDPNELLFCWCYMRILQFHSQKMQSSQISRSKRSAIKLDNLLVWNHSRHHCDPHQDERELETILFACLGPPQSSRCILVRPRWCQHWNPRPCCLYKITMLS